MEKPKKLELQSADGVQLNLDALFQIAPSCFSETIDEKTGDVKRTINFTTLRQLLGDSVDEDAEFYEFNWAGKQNARANVLQPIKKTLRPSIKDSEDWDNTQNIYIEGDNFDVLKLLQKSYLGKIKIIYIDPPYNTGNDFVYHDDSSRSQEEDLSSGNVDELGNRFRKNTDSNGRFHSEWCSMIYSRLMVARTLLTDDGVIFISIDDNEVENLKKICNEVFGAGNLCGMWTWFKSATPPNLSKKIKKNVEYVLAYQNGGNTENFRGVQKFSSSDDPFTKPQNSLKELTFPAGSIHTVLSDGEYKAGVYGTDKFPNELLNNIIIKDGVNVNDATFKNKFIWVQDKLNEELANGTRVNLSKKLVLSYKKAEYNAEVPPNLIDDTVGVCTTEQAGDDLDKYFDGKRVFSYPKPVSLLNYLLNFVDNQDCTILDFFSGSSTTAEAVMRINANLSRNCKYIMVQLPEDLDNALAKAQENEKQIIRNAIELCDQLNVPHNLCEIAKERIRRSGNIIFNDSAIENKDFDRGFRVFKLDNGNFEEVERTPKDWNQDQLDLFLNNIKSDRGDLDLLFGCMLDWGVKLSMPMTSEEVDGKMVYTVNDGDLVACFAEKVTDKVVKAMADKMPLRVIFRDSCFEQDADKINIYETFKQLLDWTDEQVVKNIRVI